MDLSPELLELMVGSSQRQDQDKKLERQQEMVNMLRMGNSGGGGHMAGRVFIPKTIANVGADAYGMYKARQAQPGIDQGMRNQALDRDRLRAQYLRALTSAMANQRPPQAAQPAQDFVMPGTPQAGP